MIPYDKRSGKIWYNADLVDWGDVKLHVLSHGLHYGSCVFEGERVYDGTIFKLEEHTERFFHSANRMGFKIPYSKEEINEAEAKGYTDSLMLDHEGNIAEATGANIFFKDKDGSLHTPIPDSFLDGITRRTVIDIAKTKNIKIIERKINPDELKNFVGCFLTGTAAEVTPVASIDKYKFEVCNTIIELSDSYQEFVRKKIAA